VRVDGAAPQLVRLLDKTLRFVDAPAESATQRAQLAAIAAALSANRPAVACTLLTAYVTAVRAAPVRWGLTAAEKAELVADASRIKAVLACR
jgi:hypothetical protein